MFRLLILTLVVGCFAFSVFGQVELGRVGRRLGSGGCDEWIFLRNIGKGAMHEENAIMQTGQYCSQRIKINGRAIALRTAKGFLPDRNWKVGRGGYEVFKGGNTTVRLTYVFTWLCPPDNENCEVYYYKGILDIRYKGFRKKVNVVGFGGS